MIPVTVFCYQALSYSVHYVNIDLYASEDFFPTYKRSGNYIQRQTELDNATSCSSCHVVINSFEK